MAIESENQISEALTPYVNPKACEANVEVEVFSEYRNTEIAGVEISCQKCNLHQRLGSVGTELEISNDVKNKVSVVIGANCFKLRSLGHNIPAELLPHARLL